MNENQQQTTPGAPAQNLDMNSRIIQPPTTGEGINTPRPEPTKSPAYQPQVTSPASTTPTYYAQTNDALRAKLRRLAWALMAPLFVIVAIEALLVTQIQDFFSNESFALWGTESIILFNVFLLLVAGGGLLLALRKKIVVPYMDILFWAMFIAGLILILWTAYYSAINMPFGFLVLVSPQPSVIVGISLLIASGIMRHEVVAFLKQSDMQQLLS